MKGLHTIITLAGLSVFGLAASIATPAVGAPPIGAAALANANVTIITPIGLAKTADLNFGQVVAHSGGQVIIAPNSTRTVGGSAEAVPASSSSAATFAVTGNGSNTYAITLPTSTTLTSNSNTITVDNFTSTPSGTGALSSGAQTVQVGATLEVGSAQAAGNYTGTFNVYVQYN